METQFHENGLLFQHTIGRGYAWKNIKTKSKLVSKYYKVVKKVMEVLGNGLLFQRRLAGAHS